MRDHNALTILEKVLGRAATSIAEILTNRELFKYESNFRSFHSVPKDGDLAIHYTDKGKRDIGYLARSEVAKNTHLIDKWKVLVPKAYGERGASPAMVLGRPLIANPPSVCTGSYLFFFTDSEAEAESVVSYYKTKFFRFLVSLRKITQDAFRPMYVWVPQQTWDHTWSDGELYSKCGLTDVEVTLIERTIRPFDMNGSISD